MWRFNCQQREHCSAQKMKAIDTWWAIVEFSNIIISANGDQELHNNNRMCNRSALVTNRLIQAAILSHTKQRRCRQNFFVTISTASESYLSQIAKQDGRGCTVNKRLSSDTCKNKIRSSRLVFASLVSFYLARIFFSSFFILLSRLASYPLPLPEFKD